jgi:hypothetical protein
LRIKAKGSKSTHITFTTPRGTCPPVHVNNVQLPQTEEVKLLIHKNILKPIWAYGIQLWGTASTSNTEILERFQSKALRMITDAPWYVPNTVIRKDLQIPTVKQEISRYSYHYSTCLSVHPNELILNLQEPPETRPLRKNRSNYQIQYVNTVIVNIVFKV